MKKVSKSLAGWAKAFVVLGIIYLLIAFIGFCLNSAWSGSFASGGLALIILSPVFNGLSVLVQNAEDEISAREMYKTDEQ